MRAFFAAFLVAFAGWTLHAADEITSPNKQCTVSLEQSAETQGYPKVVLHEKKTGQKLVLFDYGEPAARTPDFEAAWSPDGRHVAFSIHVEQINGAEVFRVTRGKATKVKMLPIPKALDARSQTTRGGEFIDHWENSRALWTSDNTKNRCFRYRFTRKGNLLADKYASYPN